MKIILETMVENLKPLERCGSAMIGVHAFGKEIGFGFISKKCTAIISWKESTWHDCTIDWHCQVYLIDAWVCLMILNLVHGEFRTLNEIKQMRNMFKTCFRGVGKQEIDKEQEKEE